MKKNKKYFLIGKMLTIENVISTITFQGSEWELTLTDGITTESIKGSIVQEIPKVQEPEEPLEFYYKLLRSLLLYVIY